MKKIVFLLTLAILISAVISFSQKSIAVVGGFIVYPNVIHLDFAKNKRKFVSKVIAVENTSTKPARVRAYTEAWDMDKEGSIKFIPNESPTSLEKYIKYNPKEFDLQPGQKQMVRITAKLPEGVDGEFRSFIFFENVPQKEDLIKTTKGKLGIVVELKTRFGVSVYAYKGETTKNATLENVKYESLESKPFIVSTIKNDGNIHNVIMLDYELINKDTDKKIKKQAKIVVMPERTQVSKVSLPVKEMESGDYKVDLQYTYKDLNEKPVIFSSQTEFSYDASTATLKNELEKDDNDNLELTPENLAKPIEFKPETN